MRRNFSNCQNLETFEFILNNLNWERFKPFDPCRPPLWPGPTVGDPTSLVSCDRTPSAPAHRLRAPFQAVVVALGPHLPLLSRGRHPPSSPCLPPPISLLRRPPEHHTFLPLILVSATGDRIAAALTSSRCHAAGSSPIHGENCHCSTLSHRRPPWELPAVGVPPPLHHRATSPSTTLSR
jgi:hypothetical protein